MLRTTIEKALARHVPKDIPFALSVPDDSRFGHYATNVAFALAKREKKASPAYGRPRTPLAIAERLAAALACDSDPAIGEVRAAPPGFVNFWVAPVALHRELKDILTKKKHYGVSKARSGEKIQVEFVSANPTGPLTLANGRGGFLGDALANVLQNAGAKIEREYYVNDTGNQILTLGKSLLAARGLIPGEATFYQGNYVAAWARAHAREVTKLKNDPMRLGERAAADFLKSIKVTLEKEAGIHFDRYTSEKRHIHGKGYVTRALTALKKKRAVYEKDGAVWLRTTAEGDDKDRVLVTKGGFPTYFLADAGHYLETKARGFKGKVNILGPDHYGYVARIQAAAKWLGFPQSNVVVTQAVRLLRRGAEVKMSKRKGMFVTFEEVVEEVGADAARFFFLSVAPATHLDFNLDLAKERSVKNPVYYTQYALVRAKSILGKIKNLSLREISRREKKLKIKGKPNFSLLSTSVDIALLSTLARFPEVAADTARDYAVHRLTRYAVELAHAFHTFYEKERVVGAPREEAAARAALVRGSVVVFQNLFALLGITARARM